MTLHEAAAALRRLTKRPAGYPDWTLVRASDVLAIVERFGAETPAEGPEPARPPEPPAMSKLLADWDKRAALYEDAAEQALTVERNHAAADRFGSKSVAFRDCISDLKAVLAA